jgi:hypothetical protein
VNRRQILKSRTVNGHNDDTEIENNLRINRSINQSINQSGSRFVAEVLRVKTIPSIIPSSIVGRCD